VRLFYVGSGLAKADHSSRESYRLCKKDHGTEKETRAQQWAVVSLMNEMKQTSTAKRRMGLEDDHEL
jgi:hypothetical protein